MYFGEGAYGIGSAARRYFVTVDPGASLPRGKKVEELTLPDAALLAGVIANPSDFDPFDHPAAAKARRAVVLDDMVAAGYITRQQADAANQAPLPTVQLPHDPLGAHDIVTAEVQQLLLADPSLGPTSAAREKRLLEGGLQISTTIDPKAQAQALAAIDSVVPDQPPFTAAHA